MKLIFDGTEFDVPTKSHSLYKIEQSPQFNQEKALSLIIRLERMRQQILKGL